MTLHVLLYNYSLTFLGTHLFYSLIYSIYFTILDFDVASHGMEEFDGGYRKLTRAKLG